MMAQPTLPKGSSAHLKDGEAAPARLLLVSSLASLDRYFAGLGTPANRPDLERAASKKPRSEFLAPPEVGPCR